MFGINDTACIINGELTNPHWTYWQDNKMPFCLSRYFINDLSDCELYLNTRILIAEYRHIRYSYKNDPGTTVALDI